MANWKKVVVSGSNAELAQITASVGAKLASLDLDTALTVADGGTGATTLTDGGVLLGSGADAITPLGQATNGQLVIGSTGADPVLANLTTIAAGSGSIDITNAAGAITLSLADQSVGIGNLSSSGTPTAGNVLKVAADGEHITFGSAATGDVQSITTPTNSGIEVDDTSGVNGNVSITMSISDLAAETSLQSVDTFAFDDVSDTTSVVTTKKVTLANLSSSIIGNIDGDVDISGTGVSTIGVDKVKASMINSDVAGTGIAQGTDGALSMSIATLNAGIVSPPNDMIAFNDSNGNVSKKQKFSDVMNIQAGGGITTSSGQFQVHLFSTNPGLELSEENSLSKLRLKSTIGGNKTFSGNLTVQGDTTLGNAATDKTTINGDLSVTGTASFSHSTNLSVADKYILLSSGSTSAGDGGIVIQQANGGIGELFGFDSSANRFGITGSFDADTSANFAPDAFMSMVVSGSSGQNDPDVAPARYKQAGNIFAAANGDIYIYGNA